MVSPPISIANTHFLSLRIKIVISGIARSGVDLELDLGGYLIPFIVFSCKKFLNTILYYKKCYLLGRAMAPRPPTRSTPGHGRIFGGQNGVGPREEDKNRCGLWE